MKSRIKQVLRRTPLRRLLNRNQEYDEQTVEIMRRVLRVESNCVDAGCHRGEVLDRMLDLAPAGQHHGFEPLPDLCRELRRKYADSPNVHIHELALNDRAGETSFQHVLDHPALSGLERRDYPTPDERVERITVRAAPLDAVLPRGHPVDLLKIDVEGGELGVLSGALDTIRANRPFIVFEHGKGAAEYYGTRPTDVFDLLTDECGLRISVMSRWLHHPETSALSRAAFRRRFDLGLEYYFLAHP
ncbi:MAG: hypothetical protein JJLCMIEE_03593 [Acidimicrobiales bacterium]|nr:MAG: FkbM family methyltransferase [Actinomycetota bacterium]MBV6510445.1 hypothetical protein [Acidimicrobiales bacterium]RIK03751.1 MAG: FkbM family methyltransferase [Acidobacteriota bacterium]